MSRSVRARDPGRGEIDVNGVSARSKPAGVNLERREGARSSTLIVTGDADASVVEHAVAMFRLLGGGRMGDIHGIGKARLAVLPGTAHFMPPGIGMLDRADWLLAIIPAFLDAPEDVPSPMG